MHTLLILLTCTAHALARITSPSMRAPLAVQTNIDLPGFPLLSESLFSATYSGTQTLILSPTLTTMLYGATLPLQPTTTLFATLPAGGSVATVSSGSATNSYYFYSTAVSSLDLGSNTVLCHTCCLWPCILTAAQSTATPVHRQRQGLTNRERLIEKATSGSGNCPIAWPGAGTTTIFTTTTLTHCNAISMCPSSGWAIVTQTNISGASTVYTSNSKGSTSFIQISTTSGASHGSNTATSTSASSATPSSTCPYAPGSTVTDYYGSQYEIECDTIFINNVISTQTLPDLIDCMSACDKYSRDNIGGAQCKGASFISTQSSNNCLLFDGSTGTAQKGAYSASLLNGLVTPTGGPNNTTTTTALTTLGSIVTPTTILTNPPCKTLKAFNL